MSITTDIQKILADYIKIVHDGVADRAAKALGVPAPTLHRWKDDISAAKLGTLSPVLEKLNAGIFVVADKNCGETTEASKEAFLKNKQMTDSEKEIENLKAEIHRQEGAIDLLKWQLREANMELRSCYKENLDVSSIKQTKTHEYKKKDVA